MQTQVEELYDKAYKLMHLGDTEGMVYADDFTRLNREIHELIQGLWSRQGKTVEEEARICLSLLMGFSVCMYGNEGDEQKREKVEERVGKVLKALKDFGAKEQLEKLERLYNSLHNEILAI